MKLILKIVVSVCLMISINVKGQQIKQNVNQGTVLLSENDIASLTKILKKYKKANPQTPLETTIKTVSETTPLVYDTNFEAEVLRRQIYDLERQLTSLERSKTQSLPAKKDVISNERELKQLQYDVMELKFLVKQLSATNATTTSVITIPKERIIERIAAPNTLPAPKNSEILAMQLKLDSIYNLSKVDKSAKFGVEFDSIKRKILALKNEISDSKNVIKTKEEAPVSAPTFNNQILFDNNAIVVNNSYNTLLDELVKVISSNPKIDVYLNGFASKTGTLMYNEKISLLRTESVKKQLINKGVHPTRILTQYHGVDYKETDDAKARRVEIELLIRE